MVEYENNVSQYEIMVFTPTNGQQTFCIYGPNFQISMVKN